MWFLIKGSFWFSLVLITLPVLDSGSREALEGAPQLEVGQSMAAAVEALAGLSACKLDDARHCQLQSRLTRRRREQPFLPAAFLFSGTGVGRMSAVHFHACPAAESDFDLACENRHAGP